MSAQDMFARGEVLVATELAQLGHLMAVAEHSVGASTSDNPFSKLVVGIVSCAQHHQRLTNYLKLFAEPFERLGLNYYVILANPDIASETGEDFVVFEDSRLFIARATEAYETLAHKLACFYRFVYRHTEYEYVVKCDDGCLLKLDAVIANLDADYLGTAIHPTRNDSHFGKCTEQVLNSTTLDFGHRLNRAQPDIDAPQYAALQRLAYASGGAGYRLSRRALKVIDGYRSHVLSLPLSYEDLLFGQLCQLGGISVTDGEVGRYHRVPGAPT